MNTPKRIVEVIYPNPDLREYVVSIILPTNDKFGLDTEVKDAPDEMKPVLSELWAMPCVDRVRQDRSSFRVEITLAYEWDEVRDSIIGVINQHIFAGEAEVSIKDQRPRYNDSRDDFK